MSQDDDTGKTFCFLLTIPFERGVKGYFCPISSIQKAMANLDYEDDDILGFWSQDEDEGQGIDTDMGGTTTSDVQLNELLDFDSDHSEREQTSTVAGVVSDLIIGETSQLRDGHDGSIKILVAGSDVVSRIEDILESHVDVQLGLSQDMSIALKTRSQNMQTFRFPGSTIREAWRFDVILHLLVMIHDGITQNIVFTKRDLYYRYPLLFASQAIVDRYVDDIARTFSVPRSLLNISAAAKGLVAGAFTIVRSGVSIIDGLSSRLGTLITSVPDDCTIDMFRVEWIIVMEKEASFRSLVESSFWDEIQSRGIILTAKGYPDIMSRRLLHLLSAPGINNQFKTCPVYGLFDSDPDGLRIMSTFKYSTAVLDHESRDLTCPNLQWLGLKTSQIHGNTISNPQANEQCLLTLTARDRRHATLMLSRPPCDEEGNETEWRHELQFMLMINKKAEIQTLEMKAGGMAGWLRSNGF